MKKKGYTGIVFVGGGTAGHVFPGISVIQTLSVPCIWVGSRKGIERSLVRKAGIPFWGIPAGRLYRYANIKQFGEFLCMVLGTFYSFFLLRHLKPRLVVSKGGFVALPLIGAAFILGIPIIAHESDVQLGLVSRLTLPLAQLFCLSWERSRDFIPKHYRKKIRITGAPVRKEFTELRKNSPIRFLRKRPRVLVLGGSLGSGEINNLIYSIIKKLLNSAEVYHQYGSQQYFPFSHPHYKAFSFSHTIAELMAGADLIISRAGATAISEIMTLEIPAILIPLHSHLSRGEQLSNARAYAGKGAAIVLVGPTAEELLGAIESLLYDRDKLMSMANKAAQVSRSTHCLSTLIMQLYTGKEGSREHL